VTLILNLFAFFSGKAMMNYHAHISVENVGTADSLPVTCQLCVADAIPSGYDPYCSPDQHWNFIEVDDKACNSILLI